MDTKFWMEKRKEESTWRQLSTGTSSGLLWTG